MQKWLWWRLLGNPANHNEDNELELSRTWEPQIILDLCHLLQEKKPTVAFLIKTKVKTQTVK